MDGQHSDYGGGIVSARECDQRHVGLEKQIRGLETWLARIDGRMWTMVFGLLLNLAGTLGAALLLLSQIPNK